MSNYGLEDGIKIPLQLFDTSKWVACVHATIQAFNVRDDPIATLMTCEDTGLLHGLSHITCVIEISTHPTMRELRDKLAWTDRIKAELECE